MTNLAYPLAAICADGQTILAHTPEEAMGFRRLNPASHHVFAYFDYEGRMDRSHHLWIVRDDHGRIVEHHDLPEHPRTRSGWHQKQLDTARHAAERGLPIPNLRRRKRYHKGYRSFASNIAMRAADAALDLDLAEWGIEHAKVGRCRTNMLPHVWDDVEWRADRRCWKDYRDNQWR